jgi:hypothetical protein
MGETLIWYSIIIELAIDITSIDMTLSWKFQRSDYELAVSGNLGGCLRGGFHKPG